MDENAAGDAKTQGKTGRFCVSPDQRDRNRNRNQQLWSKSVAGFPSGRNRTFKTGTCKAYSLQWMNPAEFAYVQAFYSYLYQTGAQFFEAMAPWSH